MKPNQLEGLIYEYHWFKKEFDRLGKILFGTRKEKSVGVAQYGVEATLPKPNTSLKSYSEMDDMDVREKRQYVRWLKFKDKVEAVESLGDYLFDEQQQIILDCMIEGMSYRSIAVHLSINRNKVRDIKDVMLCQLCQKCHLLQDLKDDREISYN